MSSHWKRAQLDEPMLIVQGGRDPTSTAPKTSSANRPTFPIIATSPFRIYDVDNHLFFEEVSART